MRISKALQASLAVGLLLLIGQAAFGYYAPPPLSAFTMTGRLNLTAATTSASGVLATNSSSTPPATTAVVENLGAVVAYVTLGTSSSIAATTTASYPVPIGGTVVLTLGNATKAAAITGSSTASVVFLTGY